jgi:hypothetical protein
MSSDFKFWKDTGVDSEKKKLTEEVMTYAFKNYNNYHEICRYIATRFKEHYNTEKWTVFGYNAGHGSGYSDFKDTFIGIDYRDSKIIITNHEL